VENLKVKLLPNGLVAGRFLANFKQDNEFCAMSGKYQLLVSENDCKIYFDGELKKKVRYCYDGPTNPGTFFDGQHKRSLRQDEKHVITHELKGLIADEYFRRGGK